MRRLILVGFLVVFCSCAAPPPPVTAPVTPAPPPRAPVEQQAAETVRVTASALNVRREPSADADVLVQVKQGTALAVLAADESWTKVRLEDGTTGWVASRFVSRGGERSATTTRTRRTTSSRKGGCESDYAFVKAPTPSFSEDQAHGLVIVEANVNTQGVVTSTKVISNNTGSESLALLAEREIKSARFSPPMRNCQPRAFIFTYRRTF